MRFLSRLLAVTAFVSIAGLAAGCAEASPPEEAAATTSTTSSSSPAKVQLPPIGGQFDYQIGGAYKPAQSVDIVDRDRGDAPAAGKYNICYVNAFQTQLEDAKFWKTKHPDLLATKDGKPIIDQDWPDEFILDPSTPAKRKQILAIVGKWIDGCARDGYQAVEPDNLDSWTRSHGVLHRADNVAMAKLLAARAHANGLAIAQKNTSQLGASGKKSIGFDFAIAEECQVYNECSGYTDPYGKRVIEIEYTDNGRKAYKKACKLRGDRISVIMRDRDVVPKGKKAYRYKSC